MKKIIAVTLLILVVFTLFFITQSNNQEKNSPTNSPFIIKSSLPGECRVTSIPATNSANINNTIVACKIQLRKEY